MKPAQEIKILDYLYKKIKDTKTNWTPGVIPMPYYQQKDLPFSADLKIYKGLNFITLSLENNKALNSNIYITFANIVKKNLFLKKGSKGNMIFFYSKFHTNQKKQDDYNNYLLDRNNNNINSSETNFNEKEIKIEYFTKDQEKKECYIPKPKYKEFSVFNISCLNNTTKEIEKSLNIKLNKVEISPEFIINKKIIFNKKNINISDIEKEPKTLFIYTEKNKEKIEKISNIKNIFFLKTHYSGDYKKDYKDIKDNFDELLKKEKSFDKISIDPYKIKIKNNNNEIESHLKDTIIHKLQTSPEKIEIMEKATQKYLKDENIKLVINQESTPCFVVSTNTINMPNKNNYSNINKYYLTLFHEIAHAEFGKNKKNEKRFKEEITAETTAFVISTYNKIPINKENHFSYLKSWLEHNRDDETKRKVFFTSANIGIKIAEKIQNKYILPEIEKQKKKLENEKKIEIIPSKPKNHKM